MKCFPLILLLSVLGWAQAVPAKPPANLNNDDNAHKALAVLNQAVAALGGDAYLHYVEKSEKGRLYSMNHGQPDSVGTPYVRFFRYPDKERLEALHTRGTVKITDRSDFILIHNGDKGYEISFKGTTWEDPAETVAYLRRRHHSIERVFRKWFSDPGGALLYEGMTTVGAKTADQVSLLNPQNDSVTLYIDQLTHLPIKLSYSWRDPRDKQRNTEEEIYDNYRPVQGIMTPYSVTRTFNGEMSLQRFIQEAKYNEYLPDSMFDATITYDAKIGPQKR